MSNRSELGSGFLPRQVACHARSRIGPWHLAKTNATLGRACSASLNRRIRPAYTVVWGESQETDMLSRFLAILLDRGSRIYGLDKGLKARVNFGLGIR